MNVFRWVFVIVIIQLAITVDAQSAEIINNPDPATVYLLQCKFSGTAPDFDAMAQADSSVKAADEFHKAELARQLAASLRARFAGLDSVKEISVSFGSRFSEYDAQNGEYDFDINDGTYVPVRAFGRDFRIDFTNGTLAQSWKLPSKQAEEVLRKNKGDRFVRLALRLALQPSPAAVANEPVILNAQIVSYDVLTLYGGVKIGSAVIENIH